MFSCISPRHSAELTRFVGHLAFAAERLSESRRQRLVGHYDHIYGDLSGQRALTAEDISPYVGSADAASCLSKASVILALETYFATVCDVISAAAISGNPQSYLGSLGSAGPRDFKRCFESIVAGRAHADIGLSSPGNFGALDWYLAELDAPAVEGARSIIRGLAQLWEPGGPLISLSDPLQALHDEVFPKNLTHVTGQFYTPPWLCDLLLDDLRPPPNSQIIDPFCGSGAFLLSSLNLLRAEGVPLLQAFRQILGIDLSPSACVAARTNLTLYAARNGVRDFSQLRLNIVCADALSPAVAAGQNLSQDLFEQKLRAPSDQTLDTSADSEANRVKAVLAERGIATDVWCRGSDRMPRLPSALRDRSVRLDDFAERVFPFFATKSDVLVTNPPWIGWEYMSRPYREELNPAWNVYSLFEQKGLQAAFLKEDISTLCVVTACDRYLREGGQSAIVLRPAAMQSDLAGRGLRRLSLFPGAGHLRLERVRLFEGLRVFGSAMAPAATWQLTKGEPTSFPIPVTRWTRDRSRWQPDMSSTMEDVRARVQQSEATCRPADSNNYSSRWVVGSNATEGMHAKIGGANKLKARIGFFTGGANSVFYMRAIETTTPALWTCENITERAKRTAERVRVQLETDLLYRVLRGRDVSFWQTKTEVLVLCPHTRDSKMYPLPERFMAEQYKYAYSYLQKMEPVLRDRNGFAGWEKRIHEEYFYTLQRIGEYTFAPFKVCWSYIGEGFEVAVVGLDASGKPIFPNDKVVFLPFADEQSAYFVAGVLSSSPIRLGVISSASSRQVSTSVIKHYRIPEFDSRNEIHIGISKLCLEGHRAMALGDIDHAMRNYDSIDQLIARLFSMSDSEISSARVALADKLKRFPFRQAA